jgi:Fe-Mn family superoxide dismutase
MINFGKNYYSLNLIVMAFELPQLPYAYDALEPHIDARTMEIHHSKHHNAYTTNLNAAIAGTDMEGKTIENILIDLRDAIEASFGDFNEFKARFSKAGTTQFGSGWAWLCVHKGGKLEVCGTPNQDCPLMPEVGCGGAPILAMDVWEHAYYLNYQNRRPDYIEAFFNVINWTEVARRYALEK